MLFFPKKKLQRIQKQTDEQLFVKTSIKRPILFYFFKVAVMSISGIQCRDFKGCGWKEVCCHCTGWRNCGCLLVYLHRGDVKVYCEPSYSPANHTVMKRCFITRPIISGLFSSVHHANVTIRGCGALLSIGSYRWSVHKSQCAALRQIASRKKYIVHGLMFRFMAVWHDN